MPTLIRIEPALFRADEAWFIYDDGRQCLRKRTPAEPAARSALSFPQIRRDRIAPCRGMDGKMHESLSSLRRTYRADGNPQGENYIELGGESLKPVERTFDRKERRDDIRAAIEDVKNGRVPPLTVLED
jgi:hypothetical protein